MVLVTWETWTIVSFFFSIFLFSLLSLPHVLHFFLSYYSVFFFSFSYFIFFLFLFHFPFFLFIFLSSLSHFYFISTFIFFLYFFLFLIFNFFFILMFLYFPFSHFFFPLCCNFYFSRFLIFFIIFLLKFNLLLLLVIHAKRPLANLCLREDPCLATTGSSRPLPRLPLPKWNWLDTLWLAKWWPPRSPRRVIRTPPGSKTIPWSSNQRVLDTNSCGWELCN